MKPLVAHEVTHVIHRRSNDTAKARALTFIWEGLAVYVSGQFDDGIRTSVRSETMGIARLRALVLMRS